MFPEMSWESHVRLTGGLSNQHDEAALLAIAPCTSLAACGKDDRVLRCEAGLARVSQQHFGLSSHCPPRT